jgi:AcrR family transcriptional regulator
MSRLPAAQRKEQLLDRAAELFARSGYARATTAQLAKAAGVTEPIIYRHFDSKRDLFVALIERTGDQTLHDWKDHLADAGDPAERLQRLIGENPMVMRRGEAPYRVMLQAITEVDDPEIHRALIEHITKLHAFITEEIQRAQKAEQVTNNFAADIIAWHLIHAGLGYGVLNAWGFRDHGTGEGEHHVQHLIARVLVGKDAMPLDKVD